MDRELNNGIIGYIIYTDESLREKEESEVRDKEGLSLGTCSAYTSQASHLCLAAICHEVRYRVLQHWMIGLGI